MHDSWIGQLASFLTVGLAGIALLAGLCVWLHSHLARRRAPSADSGTGTEGAVLPGHAGSDVCVGSGGDCGGGDGGD